MAIGDVVLFVFVWNSWIFLSLKLLPLVTLDKHTRSPCLVEVFFFFLIHLFFFFSPLWLSEFHGSLGGLEQAEETREGRDSLDFLYTVKLHA